MQDCGLQTACDVVAVHDNTPGTAERLAKGSNIGYATESFAELLAFNSYFIFCI